MTPHHTLDHHIVHQDFHGSHVRIVRNEDLDEIRAAIRLLFPHESVLVTPIGCSHSCIYAADAPASLVAERISEHLRQLAAQGDDEPAPLHPPGPRKAPDEPLPDFFGPDRTKP
jgi:hypothetical protein